MVKVYKVKYRQVVLEQKPRPGVWDGEFSYGLPEGDTKRAKAASRQSCGAS